MAFVFPLQTCALSIDLRILLGTAPLFLTQTCITWHIRIQYIDICVLIVSTCTLSLYLNTNEVKYKTNQNRKWTTTPSFCLSSACLSFISDKQEKGGLLPAKCMTGNTVPKRCRPKHPQDKKHPTPIKPSPASLATGPQPIICQNPRGHRPRMSTAFLSLASPACQSNAYPQVVGSSGTNAAGQSCVKASRSTRPAPKNVDKVSIWAWHF